MSWMAGLWAQILFQWAWQVAIAGALLLIFPMVFPRSSPQLRHALAALVLIKLCIPPLFVLPTGLLNALDSQSPSLRTGVADSVANPSIAWEIVIVHIAGMLIVLAGRVRGAIWLSRVRNERSRVTTGEVADLFKDNSRRLGVRPLPDLFVSAQTPVPFATGVFRPAVVLPPSVVSLPREELAHIMSHELIHHRRGDLRWCLLESLLGIVWWFHPAFHAAVRVTRGAREESCDDSVIEEGADTRSYAMAILETARRSAFPVPVSAISEAAGYPLTPRLVRIAGDRGQILARLSMIQLAIMIILAIVILPGMAPHDMRPENEPPESGFHLVKHHHTHHYNH